MSVNIARDLDSFSIRKIQEFQKVPGGKKFVGAVLRFRTAFAHGHVPKRLDNETATVWQELHDSGVPLSRLKEVADIVTSVTRGPIAPGDKYVFSLNTGKSGGECGEGQSQQAVFT